MKALKRSLLFLLICWELARYDAFSTKRPSRLPSPFSPLLKPLKSSREANFESNNRHRKTNSRPRRQLPQQHKRNLPPKKFVRRMTAEQRTWLEEATGNLLATKKGSLVNGKWHELVSMLNAWSKHVKDDANAPVAMEKLLKRLLDERRAGNSEAKADIRNYNRLLDAWACAALFRTHLPPVAAQRAREILVLLQETFELEQDLDLQPNMESFDVVFHAVCKTEGAQKARRVLAWMEYLFKVNKNPYAKPSRKHYIMLLDAYSNSRDGNAGHLAEGFLRHMNITGVAPDTLCYNIAIKAWTRTRRGRESAEHADQIMEEMQAPKDIVTYATVISAWAASGMRSHAVSRAEELLRAIEETPGLEPNAIVLNTVMSTWVKSKNPAAVNRTEELLEHMEASRSTPPDLISYNTHIHALSIHAKRSGYARKAQDMLVALEGRYQKGEIAFRPNLFTYNLVIDAWSKSWDPNAAWKAVEVLRKMIDGKTPDPDAFSFNQVISALSRSAKPKAPQIIEQLLQYQEDAYKLKIHRNAKPDVIGYTSAIVAWARSRDPDAPERAERLLNRMKERYAAGQIYLKPNRMSYNSLIDCWARAGRGTLGARKAEALLQEMEEMFASGDDSVAPNLVTYNAVLNSWARSGTRCCGNKAEEYLNLMCELYDSGARDVRPNDKSFNTVINAISKSMNEQKAQKALRMLRRMDKLYRAGYKEARPDEVTYTSVLNSCAFPAALDERTRRKALDTAIFTLEELQSSRYGSPNDVTYGTFMKACANLLSDDDEMRRVVIEKVFQQCCTDGQVGEMVLAHLRDAAPEDLYKKLLSEVVQISGTTISVDDLPPEWRCNIRKEERWGRKSPFTRQQGSSRRWKKNTKN